MLQFHKRDQQCKFYHGVEGAAIIEIKSNKLLGVVTWGHVYNSKFELPSGLAVANSDNFFEDYECAKTIAKDKLDHNSPLYWQKLCDRL